MIDIPDNIFPVNEKGERFCPRCKQKVNDCQCPGYDPVQTKFDQFKPVVRLEKKGRKGKTVTMLERLPSDENYLRKLAKTLKSRTGSGGTYYLVDNGGVIEIQGNQLTAIKKILNDKRIG